jgi:hypothetical protein
MADRRLQERRGRHQRQRHQSNLREAQVEGRLQQRIDGRKERLDRVVEKMREADGAEDREGRHLPLGRGVGLRARLHRGRGSHAAELYRRGHGGVTAPQRGHRAAVRSPRRR